MNVECSNHRKDNLSFLVLALYGQMYSFPSLLKSNDDITYDLQERANNFLHFDSFN